MNVGGKGVYQLLLAIAHKESSDALQRSTASEAVRVMIVRVETEAAEALQRRVKLG